MNVFLTGTGTDVGKTFLACGLVRAWRDAGVGVAACKPVMSGYRDEDRLTSDAGRLLAAMGEAVTEEAVARIAPFRFTAPLSPDIAAAREGRSIDFAAVVASCRRPGPLLVEGVGGVMVPLTERHTVLDWMAALGWPVVLVAGSYLGTISHTLSALAVLRARAIGVAAVVVNETVGGPAMAETMGTLRRFMPGVALAAVPRAAEWGDPAFRALAKLIGQAVGFAPFPERPAVPLSVDDPTLSDL